MLVSSNYDSKILAAIFIALKVGGYNVELSYICKISSINSETVKNIINICIDQMTLFTKFSKRCQNIESKLYQTQDAVSQKDIMNYIISQTDKNNI